MLNIQIDTCEKKAEENSSIVDAAADSDGKSLEAERAECISSIIQAMNVSYKEAEDMLEYAQTQLGMNVRIYSKYAFFNVPKGQQEVMLEKIKIAEQRQLEKTKEQEEKKKKYEAEIARNTGWDIDKVREKIRDAQKRRGITLDEYFENGYYRITAEEQEICHNRLLKEQKEQRRLQEEQQAEARDKVIKTISQQTGQTQLNADEALSSTLAILDITPDEYLNYRVFEVDKEEQQTWYAEIKRLESQKSARSQRSRKALIERAAMHLGVSDAEAKNTLEDISKVYKLTYAEIVSERFYSLPESKKSAVAENILQTRLKTSRENHAKHIHELAEDLECTKKEAKKIIKEAKHRLGVSSYIYTKYRFQDFPIEGQAKWYRSVLVEEEDRLEKQEQTRERKIERLVMRTGWSHAEAEQAMIDALHRSGISFSDYLNNDFYLLSPEEQDKIYKGIEEEREQQKDLERKNCIDVIMENRQCSVEEAESLLSDAEKRLKISPQAYRRYLFFNIPVAEQRERYQEIKDQLSERSHSQIDDYDSYLEKIIEATGWTNSEALKRVRQAKVNSGASWKDFYAFKFWELDDEQQKEFFTTEVSKLVTRKYDDLHTRDIFVNKEVFLKKYKEYLGRNWVISNKVSEQEFTEAFKDINKVLYKPSNNGNSGSGIEVFDLTEGCNDAYKRISHLPRGIVEGYLVQNEEMNKLYPYAVNTVRVASICHNGNVEIPYAILRLGANKSCVDNFTTGGMVADVDLETGRVRTDAVNVHGKRFALHPDTQVAIKGFEIPYFKEGLEIVRRAGHDVNGYIGWDVAICENGPVLIEGNIDPGNRLVQMPYVPEKKGMAYVMRKFL